MSENLKRGNVLNPNFDLKIQKQDWLTFAIFWNYFNQYRQYL